MTRSPFTSFPAEVTGGPPASRRSPQYQNGFCYGFGRNSGELLHGSRYASHSATILRAPLQVYIAGTTPRRGQPSVDACPHLQSAVNFFPTAYNPDTGLAHGAGIEGCFLVEPSGDQERKVGHGRCRARAAARITHHTGATPDRFLLDHAGGAGVGDGGHSYRAFLASGPNHRSRDLSGWRRRSV